MKLSNRKYTRLTSHDYCGGDYFVTVCTHDKIHCFGEIVDDKMILSDIGKYLDDNILDISQHFDDVEIPLHIVMPNHFHAIISIVGSRPVATATTTETNLIKNLGRLNQTARLAVATGRDPTDIVHHNSRLAVVVGSIKASVTRYAKKQGLMFAWQSHFHEHIIRNNIDGNRIANYIETNPIRWYNDCFNK